MTPENRHRMSFWIMDDTHKQLKKLADRASELIRQMINKSLSVQAAKR